MPVRRSSLTEQDHLDIVAPPQAHLVQPSISTSGLQNNKLSISHRNPTTGVSLDEQGHPPVIKITLYRLLNTMIILGVGIGKFILAMQGHSISPTILDWVFGSLYVMLTYWIGFVEDVRPSVWPWFFHEDCVTPCARRGLSLVIELMHHVWRGLKRNWKRELVGFLLIGLSVFLPYLLPLPDLSPIASLFAGGFGVACPRLSQILSSQILRSLA
ncbi:hypothetical protein BS47DRAFT_774400 [Hydnum rufescens UP504]|uniref:Uncharacterized protein n=1 Tax=Hydnum rufescens UP504 TaxID=1448309 RepID=A0A9P6B1B5_9AGAM|nr:hypothetical protein BS47DRAFT_774400 [Hydnum rufescens UP504]